jgi:hypothetical protein
MRPCLKIIKPKPEPELVKKCHTVLLLYYLSVLARDSNTEGTSRSSLYSAAKVILQHSENRALHCCFNTCSFGKLFTWWLILLKASYRCSEIFLPLSLSHWSLNSGLHSCLAGTPSPESIASPFFVLDIFKIESHELFAQGWPGISILRIPASWVAKITSMSHQCPVRNFFIRKTKLIFCNLLSFLIPHWFY